MNYERSTNKKSNTYEYIRIHMYEHSIESVSKRKKILIRVDQFVGIPWNLYVVPFSLSPRISLPSSSSLLYRMKVEEREREREEALHVYLVQDHPFRHVAPVRERVYVIGNLGSRVCVIDRRVSPTYLRRCCTVLRAQSRVASWRRKWLRHEKVSRICGARRNTFPLKKKKNAQWIGMGRNWNAVALFCSTLKRSLVSSAVLNDFVFFFLSPLP